MADQHPVVTEATTADVPAVSTFFWDAWRQAGPDSPGFAGATEDVIAEITTPELIRSRLGGPDRRMYIAKQDDRIVGFASTRAETTTVVELSGVIVLEELIGTGVGGMLVEAAIDASAKHGFQAMTVSTEVDNDRARSFYEQKGFEPIGRAVELVGETTVEVVNLRRKL